jgi:hypothetical protein
VSIIVIHMTYDMWHLLGALLHGFAHQSISQLGFIGRIYIEEVGFIGRIYIEEVGLIGSYNI